MLLNFTKHIVLFFAICASQSTTVLSSPTTTMLQAIGTGADKTTKFLDTSLKPFFTNFKQTLLPPDPTFTALYNSIIDSLNKADTAVSAIKTNSANLLKAVTAPTYVLNSFVTGNLAQLSSQSKLVGSQPICLFKGCSSTPEDAQYKVQTNAATATPFCPEHYIWNIQPDAMYFVAPGGPVIPGVVSFSWQQVYNAILAAQPAPKTQLPSVKYGH